MLPLWFTAMLVTVGCWGGFIIGYILAAILSTSAHAEDCAECAMRERLDWCLGKRD